MSMSQCVCVCVLFTLVLEDVCVKMCVYIMYERCALWKKKTTKKTNPFLISCVSRNTHKHFQLCQVCMWVRVTTCVCVTVCQKARQPVNVLENCGSNIFILCSEEASLTSYVYSLSCRITNSCTDTDALFIYSLLRYPPPKKHTRHVAHLSHRIVRPIISQSRFHTLFINI